MKTKIFFRTALIAAILSGAACSDSDDETANDYSIPNNPSIVVLDPEGTVVVNMMNADNGKTEVFGGYIDSGNNFFVPVYNYCGFVDLGPMNGLGNITTPVLTGFSKTCAVVPGHGYWSYVYGTLIHYDGTSIHYKNPDYKIYVDSWVTGTGGAILGARVKYVSVTWENTYGLPEMGSIRSTGSSIELTADPQGDVVWSGDSGDVRISVSGKTITFSGTGDGLLCVKDTYTYLRIQ